MDPDTTLSEMVCSRRKDNGGDVLCDWAISCLTCCCSCAKSRSRSRSAASTRAVLPVSRCPPLASLRHRAGEVVVVVAIAPPSTP
eukprot:998133-Prorocentrum_minimum.AAC.1